MKKAILNEYALNGYTVHSNLPIGTVIPSFANTTPVGFLNCDHTKIKKSDYPELWDRLKDAPMCQSEETDYFFTPDLREVSLVGIGENATLDISAHDIYELGQFKDDQMQGHSHEIEWSKGLPNYSVGGLYSGGGSYNSNVKSATELTIKGVTTDNVNGTTRAGTTTHGKQIGVRWIIKATQYATVEQNTIDDTRFTTGNVLSAAKTKAEIDAKHNYSTEETVIGKWIDGKNIYQKVLNINAVNLNFWGYIPETDNLNIKKLIKALVMGTDSSYTDCIAFPYARRAPNGNFEFLTLDWGFVATTIILEYTKTTD